MSELYSYVGSGKLYLQVANRGLFPIGEVSKADFSVEVDKKVLQSSTGGGGEADSLSRIKSVGIDLDIHNLSPENVSMALYGSVSAVGGGEVTAELHDAYVGGLVTFDNPPDLTKSVVVKNEAGDDTYDEGVDYELSPSGVVILNGAISDAAKIKVDYTKLEHDVIEALVNSGAEYRMYFEGLNEARSDKPVLIDVFRSKFDPTSNLSLITDDFGTLSISGSVLKDVTKSGNLSKFFNVKMV